MNMNFFINVRINGNKRKVEYMQQTPAERKMKGLDRK